MIPNLVQARGSKVCQVALFCILGKGFTILRMVTKLVARKEGEGQKCFFFIEIEILYKKTSYSRSFPPFELV